MAGKIDLDWKNKIKEYKQAVEEVKKFDEIKDLKYSEFDRELRNIENKYYDLKRKLEDKEREELNIISEEKDKFKEKRGKQIESPCKTMSNFKRIINFIDIYKSPKRDLNLKVYQYDYIRDKNRIAISGDKERIIIKPISDFMNNEYCKLNVYIYENSKPKNKFTLCVIGNSIFDETILGLNWNYLSDIIENGDFKKVLKELPDRTKLMEWFVKNNDKIKEQINKLEDTIQEYKNVIENTNSKEWNIAYLESKKEYYKKYVARGTEKTEYINILEELKKLKLL